MSVKVLSVATIILVAIPAMAELPPGLGALGGKSNEPPALEGSRTAPAATPQQLEKSVPVAPASKVATPIPTHANTPKQATAATPTPAPSTAPAVVSPAATAANAQSALKLAPPVTQGTAITIQALSEAQKREMEKETFKQIGFVPVGEATQVPAITPASVQPAPARKVKPALPRPYLASVVGPVGNEVATFVLQDKELRLRAGDAIERWELIEISHGRVRVMPGARKGSHASSWINVGDTLK
jgi:hypothetical protein